MDREVIDAWVGTGGTGEGARQRGFDRENFALTMDCTARGRCIWAVLRVGSAGFRDFCLIGRGPGCKGSLRGQLPGSSAMFRRSFLITGVLAGLAACSWAGSSGLGAGGAALPTIYRINPDDTGDIQFRVLDSVNALRRAAGVPDLRLNAALNAAAATHSRDMSVQNRPWHFGSDGSSPIDRAARAGYSGGVLGENISETYESELETVAAWMELADTREVITDPEARDLGIAFFQEPNGKIWWTMVTGDGSGGQ